MTRLYLVRHAAHGLLGCTLAGRMPGVHLSVEGRGQADRLGMRLAATQLNAIWTSPLERARETAEAIARRVGVGVEVAQELTEIDFGEWTGRSFEELNGDPEWHAWNALRSLHRPPGGESMLEVQARILILLQRLQAVQRAERVCLVTHGDLIKAALAHLLGIPIDLFQRIEIAPASVSIVELRPWGPLLLRTGDFGELP